MMKYSSSSTRSSVMANTDVHLSEPLAELGANVRDTMNNGKSPSPTVAVSTNNIFSSASNLKFYLFHLYWTI